MNELRLFNNPKFGDVRTITGNGKILFCGSDIAKALGYSNPQKAIKDHCKGTEDRRVNDSLGRQQSMKFITEGDVYRLAAKSQLPGADKFESWIFDEVIPDVRKHGAYMTPEAIEAAILNPDTIIKIATALKEEKDKNKALEALNSKLSVDNTIMKPKAEYFDELVDRNLLTGLRETAKELQIKERELTAFLLRKKYVFRNKKGKLEPYAQHVKNGLFELKECFNDKTQWSGTQMFFTPKGRETFRLLYLKSA